VTVRVAPNHSKKFLLSYIPTNLLIPSAKHYLTMYKIDFFIIWYLFVLRCASHLFVAAGYARINLKAHVIIQPAILPPLKN